MSAIWSASSTTATRTAPSDISLRSSRSFKRPGFGDEKAKIFIALLAKRFGVEPQGWKTVAKPFGDHRMRTVADIDSAEALQKVRRFKQLEKARDRDKQSRPLKQR